MIGLSIVSIEDENSSIYQTTYSGQQIADKFKLVCTTDGFSIVEAQSSYDLKYSTNTNEDVTPINAGNYYVSLDVSSTKTVVVERQSDGQQITFSALSTKVDGCVLSLSQYAYLNIAKADINYVESQISFSANLVYGSDASDLPNINTTYEDGSTTKDIFTGVDGNAINLKIYDNSKNFVFTGSPQSIETLEASASISHSIKLIIQASNVLNEIDSNYNSLQLDVQIFVDPQERVLNMLETFQAREQLPILAGPPYSNLML